jgi:predicted permease
MTLPLALICIGGALSLSEMKRSSGLSAKVVFAKLVLVPVIVTISAYLLGFSGVELGCILLMFASPTATASFIMVRKMGENYALASNIIVISSLCSALSISILLYLAKMLGWF